MCIRIPSCKYSNVPHEVARLPVVADDHFFSALGPARFVLNPAAAELGRRAPHDLGVVAGHRPRALTGKEMHICRT